MTIFYLLLIGVSTFGLLVGALSLRVDRKQQKKPNKVTFGSSVDKHLLQSGMEVEHGMVINKSGKLQAQSKISEGYFESMLAK